MLQKFYTRLFTIIFLPLVACQLPGGQAAQPAEQQTPVPTAPPTAEPTIEPTSTSIAENPLEFETLALNESIGNITAIIPEPQLLLLTSQADVQKIADWINPETATSLQQIDFSEFSVIALFRGWHPSTNYKIVIEKIAWQEGQLIIYAQFWEPAPNQESGAAETSPYHLVKIDKKLLLSSSVELVLKSRAVSATPPP